jgi:hypothetical protein
VVGRRQAADPPGRVDAGDQSGGDGQHERQQQHPGIEREQAGPVGHVQHEGVQGPQRHGREQHTERAAEHRDDLALDQVLQEHVTPRRAERTADADLVGTRQELAEQQANEVDRRDREEEKTHHQQRERLLGRDVEVVHQRRDARHPVVERAAEPAELTLFRDVALDEGAIGRLVRGRAQVHPVLQPAGLGVEEAGVAGAAAIAPAIAVAGGTQFHRHHQVEWHEHRLGFAQRAAGHVVHADGRLPAGEHADDAEVAGLDA